MKMIQDTKMPNPLVSVVIPSYNRAQYIAETIESVIAQTYANIEIIVIDDGSTDNTRDIVEKYIPKVQYVWQENAERGTSRNHGLKLAKGEFIAFLDSDDLWLPEKIGDDLKLLQEFPAAGAVYSDTSQVDVFGNHIRILKRNGYEGDVTNRLLVDNFISIGAHLIKTSLVRKIGGFREERELSGCEDWEMWVRLSTVTEFKYLPEANTKIRTHSLNTMSNAEGMSKSLDYAFRLVASSDFLTDKQKILLKAMKANIALINAINFCSKGENGISYDYLKEAFFSRPAIILDPRFAYTILRSLKNKSK